MNGNTFSNEENLKTSCRELPQDSETHTTIPKGPLLKKDAEAEKKRTSSKISHRMLSPGDPEPTSYDIEDENEKKKKMYQDDNEYINEAQGYKYDIKNRIKGASQEQKRDVVRSSLHHERVLNEQAVNPPRR